MGGAGGHSLVVESLTKIPDVFIRGLEESVVVVGSWWFW